MAVRNDARLTTTEAAQRLDMPAATLRRLCAQGAFEGAERVEGPRGPVWMIPAYVVDHWKPRRKGWPKDAIKKSYASRMANKKKAVKKGAKKK